jgi:hypothetical protein
MIFYKQCALTEQKEKEKDVYTRMVQEGDTTMFNRSPEAGTNQLKNAFYHKG